MFSKQRESKQEEAVWKKEESSSSTDVVKYANQYRETILIYGTNSDERHIQITFYAKTQEAFESTINACRQANLNITSAKIFYSPAKIRDINIEVRKEDKVRLAAFIDIVEKNAPLGGIKKEIYSQLGLSYKQPGPGVVQRR